MSEMQANFPRPTTIDVLASAETPASYTWEMVTLENVTQVKIIKGDLVLVGRHADYEDVLIGYFSSGSWKHWTLGIDERYPDTVTEEQEAIDSALTEKINAMSSDEPEPKRSLSNQFNDKLTEMGANYKRTEDSLGTVFTIELTVPRQVDEIVLSRLNDLLKGLY